MFWYISRLWKDQHNQAKWLNHCFYIVVIFLDIFWSVCVSVCWEDLRFFLLANFEGTTQFCHLLFRCCMSDAQSSFILHDRNLCPWTSISSLNPPLPSLPWPLATTVPLVSAASGVTVLDFTHQQHHPVFVFLCVAYFTQCDVILVLLHLLSQMGGFPSFLRLSIMCVCVYIHWPSVT